MIALAVVAIALLVASVFVMDWFVARTSAEVMGIDRLGIDLRTIHGCARGGACGSFPISKGGGSYSTWAAMTFYGTMGVGLLLVAAVAQRLMRHDESPKLARLGYGACAFVALNGCAAGFLFNPDIGNQEIAQLGVSLHVIRTSAPLLLLAGCAAGIAAFYYNAVPRSMLEGSGAEPVLATARALPPAAVSPPASAAARSAATTTGRVPVPDELAGKLQFAVLAAELSAGGIDARRERGEPKLVAWSAVVGAVARRLPADAPYAGHAFVDVVSTSGSTLRFLPWTRITGELRTDPADDGVVRARRFLKQVVARCPAVHLDRATRAFLDGGDPPIQLPDAAVLAAHDERLA